MYIHSHSTGKVFLTGDLGITIEFNVSRNHIIERITIANYFITPYSHIIFRGNRWYCLSNWFKRLVLHRLPRAAQWLCTSCNGGLKTSKFGIINDTEFQCIGIALKWQKKSRTEGLRIFYIYFNRNVYRRCNIDIYTLYGNCNCYHFSVWDALK